MELELLNKFVELIQNSKNIVIFTGAGISTESGIPDFRSTGGLYASGQFKQWTPEQILSRRFFLSNPEVFYEFYKQRLSSMADKEPNRSHFILSSLEERGIVKAIITQNIDNLHQRSGSKNVWDLHGNGSISRCCVCAKKYPMSHMIQLLEIYKIPWCECGCKIRPNTVLFDEWLDDDVYNGAMHSIKAADLLIVIGSSLLVNPAAELVSQIENNCKLVILNNSKTPYDNKAELIIRENCGEVLDYIKIKI